MNRPIVLVRVEDAPDGTLQVLSPGVGLWRDPPEAGTVLGPGSGLGRLERLNRHAALILPERAAGRVAATVRADRVVPVEYGQVLLTLLPLAGAAEAGAAARAVFGQPAGTDLPPGARAVLAPTDGVFYRGPSQGAPPFVAPGDRVATGRLLGLVEVMKTFNQILYGGPGFPDSAEVIEIRCGDAQEVRAGQPLIVVR